VDRDRYLDTAFGRIRSTAGAHGYLAYFLNAIPRRIAISESSLLRLADAESALGRLAGAGRLLPAPHLLVRPYFHREAVASTRIEGTQASLVEVFDAEVDLEEAVGEYGNPRTGLNWGDDCHTLVI
jgi:Fic family protein